MILHPPLFDQESTRPLREYVLKAFKDHCPLWIEIDPKGNIVNGQPLTWDPADPNIRYKRCSDIKMVDFRRLSNAPGVALNP